MLNTCKSLSVSVSCLFAGSVVHTVQNLVHPSRPPAFVPFPPHLPYRLPKVSKFRSLTSEKVSCSSFLQSWTWDEQRSFLSRRSKKVQKNRTMISLGPSAPSICVRAARFSTPTTDTNALRDKSPVLGRCRRCSFQSPERGGATRLGMRNRHGAGTSTE